MAHETAGWGPAERQWLRQALRASGHTQASCAKALREEFGAARASQALVSRWLSGNITTPEAATALLAYCEHYAPGAVGGDDFGADGTPVSDLSWPLVQSFADQLDALRDELRRERARSRSLARQVEQLGGQLAEALEAVDRVDEAASVYSDALRVAPGQS